MLGGIRGRTRAFVRRHDLTHNDAAIFTGSALTSVMSIGLGLILVGTATTTTVAQPPAQTKVVRPQVTVTLPTTKATPAPQVPPAPQAVAAQPPTRIVVIRADRATPPTRQPSPAHSPKPAPSHSASPQPKPTETCNSVPLTGVKVCHG